MQADPVIRVLGALERERVRYAVFGAVAVNVHGLPRFTEDLDIFVAPERENVEALKRALHSVFCGPEHRRDHRGRSSGRLPRDPVRSPRGGLFHKHRTLASKNALQESWADANFSACQQRQQEESAALR
jgi:hypothetical protein